MNEARVTKIRERLAEAREPERLQIVDESPLHAGHAGARDGRGHFEVVVVSDAFDGRSRIERHRMVFDALGSMMETDIHALSINAYSPGER